MSSGPREQFELDISGDIEGFFSGLLERAIEERGVTASDAVSTYLCGLLADYARPGTLSTATLERPFTLLLAEAMESRHAERFQRLRNLGDAVLYVRGFFSEHLATRGVALDYVSSVGARAYDSAGALLRQGSYSETTTPDLFGALASGFDDLVALFETVADSLLAQSNAVSEGGVLKLYERWLRTGSVEIERALVTQGLLPMRKFSGVQ